MTEVCFHIGLPKTGSSAIQGFLRDHADALADCGIHYSLSPEAIADVAGVPNGNGRALLKYLDPRRRRSGFDVEEFERTGFDRHYVSNRSPISLISSELLAGIEWPQLRRLRDRALRERPVKVIAVARNIYDHALSTWNQNVKWHAYSKSFERFALHEYENPQLKSIWSHAKAFGWSRLRIINYEESKQDLVRAFLETVGVAPPPLWRAESLNRSLTSAELAVQRALNRIHGQSALSKKVAERLIAKRPTAAAARIWRPDIARALVERFGPEFEEVARRSGMDFSWMLKCSGPAASTVPALEYAAAALDVLPAVALALGARLTGRGSA